MVAETLEALVRPFSWFRMTFVAVGLLALAVLWRNPQPRRGLAIVVGVNLAAWWAYVAPLGRLYALDEHLDMSFNVGMAACVAAGGSPFEHTQTGFPSLEPLWLLLVAALSLFRPERVLDVYFWLAPLALVAVAYCLYGGLRTGPEPEDAWERTLVVAAVLGLASFSLSQRSPVPPFWTGNFLLKPNHSLAFAVTGLAVGARARGGHPAVLGFFLALLAWVFILDWAFVCAGLVAAALVPARLASGAGGRRAERRALFVALGTSTIIAAPYVAHLLREYHPRGPGGTSRQIWHDAVGAQLALPHWATLDLGLLFLLGLAGAALLWRRRSERDRVLLGLLASAWILWAVYGVAASFGVSPEPEEHHYFLRLVMALAAGTALAGLARALHRILGLAMSRAHVLVLAAMLPLSFPAGFDPPTMDRYYRVSLDPVPPSAREYASWVRENTAPSAIFAAGRSASIWIPALAGRHVLLTDDSRPPGDYEARKAVERTLMTSVSADEIRDAAARYGISYLAVDRALANEYGADNMIRLRRRAPYEWVFANADVSIVKISGAEDRLNPGGAPSIR